MSKGRLFFIQPPFKLSKKLEGKTKENFEIVIARYDEKGCGVIIIKIILQFIIKEKII